MYLTLKEIREMTENDLDTALQCYAQVAQREFPEGSPAEFIRASSLRMSQDTVLNLCERLTAINITDDARN